MLFSNPEVATFIRENFVAAWESVRPVPTVEIDFGNGNRLKRTLNGNIATYLCDPTGRVLDIIPGLNTPEAYLQDLRQGLALSRSSEAAVLDFHRARLEKPEPDRRPVPADLAKDVVEAPVKKDLSEEEKLLAADTELNRRERKPLVHAILAEKACRPGEITRRVYKDVLHTDLDDPYLGLVTKTFGGGAY